MEVAIRCTFTRFRPLWVIRVCSKAIRVLNDLGRLPLRQIVQKGNKLLIIKYFDHWKFLRFENLLLFVVLIESIFNWQLSNISCFYFLIGKLFFELKHFNFLTNLLSLRRSWNGPFASGSPRHVRRRHYCLILWFGLSFKVFGQHIRRQWSVAENL